MMKLYQYFRIFSLAALLFFMSGLVKGQVFISELADPNNDSGARFVELYNAGGASFDLAANNYALLRYTNGNVDPQTAVALTGSIPAGGFYVISPNGTQYTIVYGLTADQDIGTGGPADSNGDDQILLIDNTDNLNPITIDIFGVIGEDGSGTGHEFEDGRAERKSTVTTANATWDVNEWDVDNDSGGGAGALDAPAGFDPATWVGIPTCTAPTTQATAGTPVVNSDNQITMNWSRGNGTAGVVVLAKEGSGVDADPSSGVDYTSNAAFGTGDEIGTGNRVVYKGTGTSVAVTSLNPGTTYHFAVYEYNTTDVCYNTPGVTASETTTSSFDSDSDITDPTSQVGVGGISSLADTGGEAVDVFTFKLTDAGSGDASATLINEVVIEKGSTNNVADWSAIIAGAILNDGSSDLTATSVTINTDNITFDFSGNEFSVADNSSEELTLSIYLTTSVTDGEILEFEIPTSHSIGTDTNGSGLVATLAGAVTSNLFTVSVAATTFNIDVATGLFPSTDFALTATAQDANGNTDLAARNITLSRNAGTGTLSSALVGLGPLALTNGVYAWTDLQHDTSEDITIDAADGVSITTTSATFDVSPLLTSVFFSEYIEGSSSNKALEIYNASGSTIDLTQFAVERYGNGSPTASSSDQLTGTLAAGEVYVIGNSSAGAEIAAEADINTSATFFNGDDAMGLLHKGVLIDVIGEIGNDPGSSWDAAGVTGATANHTMVRKSSILEGNATNLGSFGTDAGNSEWIVTALDDFSNIGSHTIDGVSTPVITVTASLTDFGSVDNASSSASQNFTVSGTDLTADITVTAPTNYMVSLDDASFSASVQLPLVVDLVATTTVYVQFNPTSGSNGVKSGDIVISSTGAANGTIAVTGTEAGNVLPTSGVFITELADPNNNAGLRYIELYNSTDAAVDFTEGSGWRIDKYTNASATVSQTLPLTGSIPSKGFYIIAAGAVDADFEAAYGIAPNLFDGADNNVAGSNGDDNLELYNGSNVLIDQFGVPGEDGTDTNHEFEDGRAERKSTITAGNPVWDVDEWNIDNDGNAFPGNGTQDAPDDFDIASWVGTGGSLITVDITSFSGDFGGVESGSISASSSFSVTGSGLTDDITLTVPSGFTVSLDDATFTTSVVLSQSGGSVSAATVYARFEPSMVQAYSENIILTSAGASDKIVAVSGTGLGTDVIFYEDFAGCDVANYNTISITGAQLWSCTPNGQTGDGARMSGFDSGAFEAVENEDWLITSAIDLSSVTNATLTFVSDVMYDASPALEILASSDYSGSGDPTTSSWTTLSALLDEDADNFDTWTASGDLDLTNFIGANVYIAFKYTSTTSLAPTWSIDDILIEDRSSVASPSFAITETLTDFGNLDNGSVSTSQSFTVEGADLVADVTVTAPANFELSLDDATFTASVNLAQTAGTLTSTSVHVRFAPTSGTNAVITGDITVSTTSANDQLIAVSGTETGNTAITNDLFFSEYLEGTSNNRALEIFNGTGASVDLSNYSVKQSHNGVGFGNDPDADAYDLPLTGTLADGDVYVIYNVDATDATIIAEGDLPLTYGDTGGTRMAAFTGDDALGLFKNGTLIDLIGDAGNRPTDGWNVAGVTVATQNHTLVRKQTITTGNITPLGSFGTDTDNSEWVVLDLDDVSSIGSHTGSDPVDPGFTLTTTDFNGDFGSIASGEVSTASSYIVSGTQITGDFTITIPEGFEASLTSDFSNKVGNSTLPLSITPAGGDIDNVTVYVRFTPDAAASFSGDLVNSAAGYDDATLPLTGTGTDDVLGLENILKYNIQVYPNPASKLLSINVPNSFGEGYVKLVNLEGAIIKTGSIGSINGFDVSNLRSGIYLLQIMNQQTVISHRVIIK